MDHRDDHKEKSELERQREAELARQREADLAADAETRAAAVNSGGVNAAMNNASGASTASFVPPSGPAPDEAPAVPGEGAAEREIPRQPYTETIRSEPSGPTRQNFQQPVQGQPYQQPVQGQPFQQPIQGQYYQQPVQGQPYQQPIQGQPYQQPIQGQPYQQPIQGQPMYTQQAEPGALAGLQSNIASVIAYLFGWISGLIFYFGDKRPLVRFHAMQSILLTGAVTVFYILINMIFGFSIRLWVFRTLLTTLISLGTFALVIYLMVAAYGGKKPKLPIIGDIAERLSNKPV